MALVVALAYGGRMASVRMRTRVFHIAMFCSPYRQHLIELLPFLSLIHFGLGFCSTADSEQNSSLFFFQEDCSWCWVATFPTKDFV